MLPQKNYRQNRKHAYPYRSVEFTSIEADSTYTICTAIADNEDTVFFYCRLDEYNNARVSDTKNLIKPTLTDRQISYLEKSSYFNEYGVTDGQLAAVDWDEYWEFLRQVSAYHFYIHNNLLVLSFNTDREKGQSSITCQLESSEYTIDHPKLLFVFDEDYRYPVTMDWDDNIPQGVSKRKQFVINEGLNAQEVRAFFLCQEVFSDEWLESYLQSEEDDFLFWYLYANWPVVLKDGTTMTRDTYIAMIEGVTSGLFHNPNLDSEIRDLIDVNKSRLIDELFMYHYIDQFQDTEYTFKNVWQSMDDADEIWQFLHSE